MRRSLQLPADTHIGSCSRDAARGTSHVVFWVADGDPDAARRECHGLRLGPRGNQIRATTAAHRTSAAGRAAAGVAELGLHAQRLRVLDDLTPVAVTQPSTEARVTQVLSRDLTLEDVEPILIVGHAVSPPDGCVRVIGSIPIRFTLTWG